ncbi:glycosyl hydrolase family protein [Cereibacter changlensis]|uniref:Glycosyl hydrolase family protein n=1 Tax=Cereibacter changlensis TaxID=402884 RepID=A0A4U0YX26_9RHOB|nr:family 16 glycosylhydrolase [Cereibacter changlensis]TKA95176.1 glycosyl hydrolase family protein [Cereibacter changlensis]
MILNPRAPLSGAALALLLSTPLAAAESGSFFDPFDRLSQSRWFVSDGWTNGEHQNCTWARRAVGLTDGVLRLTYIPDPKGQNANLCSEIQTNAVFSHGTYEARMKTDHRQSGLNAAFFTYIGPVHKKPHDEIDFEILTRNTSSVDVNTYVSGKPQNGRKVALPTPSDQDFHIYSFTWEPDRLRWYIDGKLMHEATENLPVTPQKIFFSHWSTDRLTEWMGPFMAPAEPVALEVDWVAFTKTGEPCQFPDSVLCTATD